MVKIITQEEEIINKLNYYTGTTKYYKFNFGNNVLTDGMKAFADLCKCYWLLTDIDAYFLSNHKNMSKSDNRFWLVTIKSKDKQATLTIKEDIGIKPIIKINYSYTDFPLKEYEFYVCKQDDYWVYLLKSEY